MHIIGITAYDDVAEFNWKVWGDDSDHALREIYGEIELPAAVEKPEDVYSWGHPKINGKIGLVENKKLINFDQSEQIEELARLFSPEDAAERIKDCFTSLRWIDASVNEKLVFEQLLLNLAFCGRL